MITSLFSTKPDRSARRRREPAPQESVRREAASADDARTEVTTSLEQQIRLLEGRVCELEREREDRWERLARAENMHLNRRGQVLEMHRRGDPAEQIAAALSISRAEVQLTIKVQELRSSPKQQVN